MTTQEQFLGLLVQFLQALIGHVLTTAAPHAPQNLPATSGEPHLAQKREGRLPLESPVAEGCTLEVKPGCDDALAALCSAGV